MLGAATRTLPATRTATACAATGVGKTERGLQRIRLAWTAAGASATRLAALPAAETGAAIGFGLLTVDTLPQAVARSGEDRMNKGAEAAQALLGQVALRRRWNLA